MKHSSEFLLVFVLGAILGGVGCWYWMGMRFNHQIVDCSYIMLVDDVNTLAMLKKNRLVELEKDKEEDLSYSLLGLSSIVKLSSISDKNLNKLKMAARYRYQYPYQTGDTNVDQTVEDFLKKVRQKP